MGKSGYFTLAANVRSCQSVAQILLNVGSMHGFANPARFLRLARLLTGPLLFVGIAVSVAAMAWGLFGAPAERLQGDSVRILFVHVPAAWLGMGGWSAIAIASLTELVWRHPLAGIAARAIALPGAFFALLCLVTGSLWGRPAWGTWWVWDGRSADPWVLWACDQYG